MFLFFSFLNVLLFVYEYNEYIIHRHIYVQIHRTKKHCFTLIPFVKKLYILKCYKIFSLLQCLWYHNFCLYKYLVIKKNLNINLNKLKNLPLKN